MSWDKLAPSRKANAHGYGFPLRLMQTRENHGYAGPREAARAIGINHVTYTHHENGRRNPSMDAVEIYARHFGVTSDFLLYGTRPMMPRDVPVVGAISTGGKIVDLMQLANSVPKSIHVMSSDERELQSLVVNTDDLYPAYRLGDMVFYAKTDPDRDILDPEKVDGQECVVVLANGMTMLRVCHADPNGYWTLECWGAKPIREARLISASPVLWVHRSTYTHERLKLSS